MVATVDKTVGGPGPAAEGFAPRRIVRYRLDMRKVLPGNGDTIKAFNVSAGTLARFIGINVLQAEGATLTVDIGDGDTANGYANDLTLNTAGFAVPAFTLTEGTPNTVAGFGAGKLYTVDDTIDLLVNQAAADTAVADLFFEFINLASGPAL
jgi:hypothetical protein